MRATSAAESRPDWIALRPFARYGSASGLVAASVAGRLRSDWKMPVFTYAGHSTDTPMLASIKRKSCCRHSDNATTACLLAVYTLLPGTETSPATDAVFT